MSVLDVDAATAAREEGIATADAHADYQWKADMTDIIEHVARSFESFTTDDVWNVWSMWYKKGETIPTHDHRALGGLMRQAQAYDWIIPSDEWRLSKQVSCHRRPKRVWKSLLWRSGR
jgi:hypothetical protein